MGEDPSTRSARELYESDRVSSRLLGMQLIEAHSGYARLVMRVRDDMVNGHGLCHGGIIFALADSAFELACNVGYPVTVASSGTIEFLRPALAGDELTAIAQERARSRRSGIYDIAIHNQKAECVALFRARSRELAAAAGRAADGRRWLDRPLYMKVLAGLRL